MRLDSKNIFWTLINVGLAVLIVGMLYGVKVVGSYGSSLAPSRTIMVSAEGKAVATPDIAQVSFSVISEGVDPVKIQENNTQKINAAIDFVKDQGIKSDDIQTSQYNLYPRYEYDKERRQTFISGYQLVQGVSLKIRDFSKISFILAGLPNLGVNEIGQLRFEVDDQDVYLNQARAEAFAKAYSKAKVMAKQNGVSIKRVVTFSESQGYYPPGPIYRALGGAVAEDMAMAPTIEPGSQELNVVISVTYEIR
ncbi:MAG: SIMPL domain-containing protein [bacterium]|nr:SIMPL domain-containing protein [bacterium]